MVRVTCLSPTKATLTALQLCSLGTLDLQSSNNDPSTRSNQRATIQRKQQEQLKTIHQNKRKVLKEHAKA